MPLSNIRASSWIVTACLIILAVVGICSFFHAPKNAAIVFSVLTAITSVLNHVLGVRAGGEMPQQAGDAKPGQSSETKIERTVTAPDPAPPADALIGKQ